MFFTQKTEIFSRSVAKQQEIKYIEAKFDVIYFLRSEWVIDVLFIVRESRGFAANVCGRQSDCEKTMRDPAESADLPRVHPRRGYNTGKQNNADENLNTEPIKTRLHSHIKQSKQSKYVNRECLSFKLLFSMLCIGSASVRLLLNFLFVSISQQYRADDMLRVCVAMMIRSALGKLALSAFAGIFREAQVSVAAEAGDEKANNLISSATFSVSRGGNETF